MTAQERALIDLARRVREAQRAYYATRSRDRLNASMKLERQLDDALDAYDAGRPVARQAEFAGVGR